MPKAAPTPEEDFLLPLAELAALDPGIEGLVIWAQDGVWPPPDAPAEMLEAEEIAFYAEGLMAEGFGLSWDVLALPDSPEQAVAIRLMVWQGDAPLAPPPPAPWSVLDRKDWTPR